MELKRVFVKLLVEKKQTVDLPALGPVFHRWIQAQVLDGLLIDVADYKHVPSGPGVMLIAHEGDWAWDLVAPAGWQYRLKRHAAPLAEQLQTAVARLLQASLLLETDTSLRFRTNELIFTFPDRFNTPNNNEGVTAVQDSLNALLDTLYPGQLIEWTRGSEDPRRPLTLHAHIPAPVSLPELAQRLETPVFA